MSRRHSPRVGHIDRDEDRTTPRGTRAPASTPESMGQLRPEYEAEIERLWTECRDAGRPVSRRHLRSLYVHHLENGQADWDFGGYVLTYVSRRGQVSRSVPADAMAERVAASLTGGG